MKKSQGSLLFMYIVYYIISVQENSACLNSTDTPFSLSSTQGQVIDEDPNNSAL